MTLQPALDNGGRWDHIASEAEVSDAMRDKESTALEAPVIQITFLISYKLLTIVRAGAMGGDVMSVEGGWVYGNVFSMMRDVEEIKMVAGIPVRGR